VRFYPLDKGKQVESIGDGADLNNQSFRETLITDLLRNSACRYPDKPALVFGDVRLTYSEIEQATNRFANVLLRSGFQRADRAVILLENSPAVVIAMLGAVKAGGVFSIVNPTTKAKRLAYIVDNCQARVLISDYSHTEMVQHIRTQSPCLQRVWLSKDSGQESDLAGPLFSSFEKDIAQASPVCPRPSCIDLDMAALIYTSGSTGRPKGVMLTHLNMVSATTSINTYLENTPDDIILNILPLSFDYGLYQILLAFQVGATVLLERSFGYPYSVIGRMIKEHVTGLPGAPTLFALLFRLNLGNHRFPALRYITNTGAALPPSFGRKLQELFPGVKIYSMYGLTECKRVSYLPPEELPRRPTSVGRAMPNVEVYIVDEQGNPVRPSQVGELVVRGSNVMRGYWGDQEGTAKVLRPGRYLGERELYTGDLFRMDEEGYLYFVARKDDMIKSRGELVSPKEIEDVLYELEGISEAKVVGVPDEVLGQAIKAVVTLHPGVSLSRRDILQHCAHHLESFKVPNIVKLVSALPKTASGKIALSA